MEKKISVKTSENKITEVLQSSNFSFFLVFISNAVFQSQGVKTVDTDTFANAGIIEVLQYTFPLLILLIKKIAKNGINMEMLKSSNFRVVLLTIVLFILKAFDIDISLDTASDFVDKVTNGSWNQAGALLVVIFNSAYHIQKPKKYPKEEELPLIKEELKIEE